MTPREFDVKEMLNGVGNETVFALYVGLQRHSNVVLEPSS